MRSYSATHNLTAISATTAETAINTFAPVDLALLSDIGDVININPRREDNRDEANGKEEPDTIYDNGYTAETTRTHNKAQPQHFAYLFGFGLGVVESKADGTGYMHTITPLPRGLDQERELPSMTMLARFGDSVLKRRFASMFVDEVTASFAADDWVKITGKLQGTGKHEDNIKSVMFSAAGDATSITLPAGTGGASAAAHGATDKERLDSIHRIQVELSPGVWTDIAATAVSDADPAVITIDPAPGATSDTVQWKVLYVPAESGDFAFPPRVVESNLRVAEMHFTFGGSWNGTEFVGGRKMCSELQSIECGLANNSKISFVPCGGGSYASMHERGGRAQTVKVNRRFRDFIFQQHIKDNDSFGLYIRAEGAEFAPGERYQVEIIYPRVGLLTSPISVSDKKLAEAGDFIVLESGEYPTTIVRVKNKWANYAK